MPYEIMTMQEIKSLANDIRRTQNRKEQTAQSMTEQYGIPLEDSRILSRSLMFVPVQDQHPRLPNIVFRAIHDDQIPVAFRRGLRAWLLNSMSGNLKQTVDKLVNQ